MKTKILLLLASFALSTSIAFTATHTVSNHPLGGAQYKTLQAAYDASDVKPFTLAAENRNKLSELDRIETEYDIFKVNLSVLKQITRSAQETMIMKIPGRTSDRNLDLELVKVDIFTPDFLVTLGSGGIAEDVDLGTHYRGIIKGDEKSVVAISIYEEEVMGLIASDAGNLVLGKLKGPGWNGEHVLYNDRNVLKNMPFECGTLDDGIGYTQEELEFNGSSRDMGDCIRLYIEAEHFLYNYFGSTGVYTYVTGLLNQVITLYNNENIAAAVSEIMAWDVPDPYTGTTASELLSQFQQNTDSINGDLGQLLIATGVNGINIGGIAAGGAGICNQDVDQSLCCCGIIHFYNIVPTYSRSVFVCTHELGHLFGSRHTHACVWNGDNTAIDGCAGYTEENCLLPPNPPEGGTIMSYCNQTEVGINFNLGFGPQPGNVIRNNVVNADCTSPCGPPSCTDNIQNGQETGVDCGGPDCAPCPCEPVTDGFPVNPLTHTGPGSSSTTLNFGSPLHQDVSFIISDMNVKMNGKPSKKYIEVVTVTYNDSLSTQTYGTFYGDQQSSEYIYIPGPVAWVSVSLADGYDDGSTSSTMSITFSQVSSCGDDGGGCSDADGDGVCDADDVCPGWDDNLLGTPCDDGDVCTENDVYVACDSCAGIPGGCDCIPVSNDFPTDPLTHSGPGQSSTSYNYGAPGHTEVSFVVSGLDAKKTGAPNGRYIDLVTVTYTDAGGTQTYGTFSGENTSSANVDIAGPVYIVTVVLEDGWDGNPPITLSVDPSSISSCPPDGSLPEADDFGKNWFDSNIPDLSVYPNPAQNSVTLNFNSYTSCSYTIDLVDITGRKLTTYRGNASEGENTRELDIESIEAGMYQVVLILDGKREVKKLVIE